MLGVIGKKLGMTKVYGDNDATPVTVVLVDNNRISQVKKLQEKDGYNAYQVTAGLKKAKKVTKPLAGHFAKAQVEAGRKTTEFRMPEDAEMTLNLGDVIKADLFAEGQIVDVTGTSIGKGFQGAVKRWNFKTQDATHGNSLSHRAPGSIGQNQTPGKVFKGKKMSGQMGNKRKTIQNLEIISVDIERNLLLIKGAIPGAVGGYVKVRPAVKKLNQQTVA